MGVLIVDSNVERRQKLFELIKWADRRLQVKFAGDGSAAWQIAASWRPHLIFCSLQLPDISTPQLYAQMRQRLCRAMMVGYGEGIESHAGNIFHAVLQTPLERLAIVPLISAARKARIGAMGGAVNQKRSPRQRGLCENIKVEVCFSEESLVFSFEMPAHSTIAGVLHRLGREITDFSLFRSGESYAANASTPLSNGDRLVVREVCADSYEKN